MAPRVDFYILSDADEMRRQQFVCRLVSKAWQLGHRIQIHAPDLTHLRALDERLWTFDQESFLPHECTDQDDHDPDCPILLVPALTTGDACDLLINEAADMPDTLDAFPRIAEVVNQAPAIRDAGRRRYSAYRDRNVELHHHRIDS